MNRPVLRMLREAPRMSRLEAIAVGVVSSITLAADAAALESHPTDLLAWTAVAVLLAVGLQGLAIAGTALLRGSSARRG